MPLVYWNDNLSVKIDSMDEQHKKLVAILNELYDFHEQRKSKQVIEKTLKKLVSSLLSQRFVFELL